MSDDLAKFLSARLDEDEAVAKAAARIGASWELRPDDAYEEWPSTVGVAGAALRFLVGDPEEGAHAARHDPARVLREVAAKRAIVDSWKDPAEVRHFTDGAHDGRDWDEVEAQVAAAEEVDDVIRTLATIWSDHPDYQPEWDS